MKGQFVFRVLCLVMLLQSDLFFGQTDHSLKLLGKWVNCYDQRLDTLVYLREGNPLLKTTSARNHLGLNFFAKNVYWYYPFKKCGNDSSPDYYVGSWDFFTEEKSQRLNLTEEDGTSKTFLILQLTEEKLILSKVY